MQGTHGCGGVQLGVSCLEEYVWLWMFGRNPWSLCIQLDVNGLDKYISDIDITI